jgi:hypothetical protein
VRIFAATASTSMAVPTVGTTYNHKMCGIIAKTLAQGSYV